MCKGNDCKKTARFNFIGLKALYCGTCKEPDMVYVYKKHCIHPDCNTRPAYNKEGEPKGLYCAKHKLKGMINIESKLCIHIDCKKIPCYNKEGESKALYCSKHKLEKMINVLDIGKRCINEGCKKSRRFNKEGETKGLYCASHKLIGMVDIVSKKCINEGCKKQPIYNKEGETKGLYCGSHKLIGMVNVQSKCCIHEGCRKQPVFNTEYERKRLYCVTHKLEGMINVKRQTFCIHKGCKKLPNFNTEYETKGLYCSTHKLDGMINVVCKTCIHLGCKMIPSYNKEGEKKGLYCSKHKLDGMLNVCSKSCKSTWCSTRVHEKYDGYCLFCYMNLFPDKPVSRNYKTKEYTVVEYVKTVFPSLPWIADKIIQGGCSKRRPDLLLDLLYQVVIIEVDENQHTHYDCSCENKRIMELSQDLGHRPIVFIRFNPDDYDKNGTNITSCWGQDKKGICVVKQSKKIEWEQRLNALKENINYWINQENITNKTIETIQLFYDE
jgi:hypothetical protein